ncbi:hypothetical protein HOD29_01555, partial [archaeon]|nr:hypothetical protein [archaeon]
SNEGQSALFVGGGNRADTNNFEVKDASLNTDFIIMGDGNVGIGTTSPNDILHLSSLGNPKIRVEDTTSNKYVQMGHGDNYATFNAQGSTAYWFQTDGDTKMTILSGGNVGIGTTSPTAKLDVQNGGVNIYLG